MVAHNPEWNGVVGVHWISAHPNQLVLEYTHLGSEQSCFSHLIPQSGFPSARGDADYSDVHSAVVFF